MEFLCGVFFTLVCVCIKYLKMDVTRIKDEIKEEVPDELLFDCEEKQYDNFAFSERVNSDEDDDVDDENGDELDNYEYTNAATYSSFDVPAVRSTPKVYTRKRKMNPTINPTKNVECENVYIDGEPEVSITNFSSLMRNRGCESPIDPLAIHAPHQQQPERPLNNPSSVLIQQPQTSATAKRARTVPFGSFAPVKNLVSKTYSSEHRTMSKAKITQHICNNCKHIFRTQIELQNHEQTCYYKCEHCNLIFATMELMLKHRNKCKKSNEKMKSAKSRQMPVPHKSNHLLKRRACNICYAEFGFEGELIDHQNTHHVMPNAYACHLCDRKFDLEHEAVNHLTNDH